MSGASKANQRQSTRRKGYYASQFDRTTMNKLITHAGHVVRSMTEDTIKDQRSWSHLRLKPKIDLHRASMYAESPRVKRLLQLASK